MALPGAVVDSAKLLQLLNSRRKSTKRRRPAGFTEKHPRLFFCLNLLMVVSLGFWFILHAPRKGRQTSDGSHLAASPAPQPATKAPVTGTYTEPHTSTPKPKARKSAEPRATPSGSLESGPKVSCNENTGNCAGVNNGSQTTENGVHQSFVENRGGPIGSVTVTNSSISGYPAPSGAAPLVELNAKSVGQVNIIDDHICNISSWNSFLDCINSESGNSNAIKRSLDVLTKLWDQDAVAHPEVPKQLTDSCRVQIDAIKSLILNSAADEHTTVTSLKANRPLCINEKW